MNDPRDDLDDETESAINDRYGIGKYTPNNAERLNMIRLGIIDIAKLGVALTPRSPEQARALCALDEALWAFNAAIARHGDEE